ncbi:MAG: 4-hydroxy-3-methylbut-2-enyl diphosphate reductase [Candidatus Moranbacteria bacterium]|nr:4-hydroxy-3-methylbut-2-enyl diphosphate reductase [Candidatus Moranbacteria bacterium]
MKVTLSEYAGFCDGVKRAYDIVEKISKDSDVKKPVVVLGSLVHNTDVVNRIKKIGIGKIDFDGDIEKIKKEIDDNIGTLVVTAHGIGPEIFDIAKEKGIDVVDTTCPKVIKVQRLAQVFLKRGYQIVIIGEKKHKEVQGIHGWSNKKAFIVEGKDEVDELKLDENEKIVVISQTTQNKDWVDEIAAAICKKYPKAKMYNTVCDTTKNRQSEVVDIARNNDVVFVIGSPESSNSNRLYEIAKAENPNTHFVERINDINESWIEGKNSAGVTAGASSPNWVINEIVEYLKKY